MASTLICGSCAPYRLNASATCNANSRVGASTSAWVCFLVTSILDRIGMANAAVLPVPVCAIPTTSEPASSAGMVAVWTAEGVS